MYNRFWSPHAFLSHRVKFNPGPRPGFFLPARDRERRQHVNLQSLTLGDRYPRLHSGLPPL
ncbi:hypothetical protein BGLA2_700020 [Burkholderia gladioli]|nr:hypothetical protein BGLA2_700020 [Burkholderia gladioli]